MQCQCTLNRVKSRSDFGAYQENRVGNEGSEQVQSSCHPVSIQLREVFPFLMNIECPEQVQFSFRATSASQLNENHYPISIPIWVVELTG